eukprot:scaffold1923_cov160-Amphora_coffeaeformis.AAC.20
MIRRTEVRICDVMMGLYTSVLVVVVVVVVVVGVKKRTKKTNTARAHTYVFGNQPATKRQQQQRIKERSSKQIVRQISFALHKYHTLGIMGLPAPPPMEPPATTEPGRSANEEENETLRRPIPDWQKDPHGWIDYSNHDKPKNKKKNNMARVFCVVQNLQSRPELNGSIGLVVGYDPGVRRYRIQPCKDNNTSKNNSNAKVLSLAPEKVRRANLGQQWKGKVQLLLAWLFLQPPNHKNSVYQQIRQDGRQWLRRVLPPGIIAGNAGPTMEQLDALWMGLMGTAALGLVLVTSVLIYLVGFTKACTALSFAMTLIIVMGGPEFVLAKSPPQQQSSSSWKQRCGRRLTHLTQDMCGRQLSTRGVVTVTTAWCMFTMWILFLT